MVEIKPESLNISKRNSFHSIINRSERKLRKVSTIYYGKKEKIKVLQQKELLSGNQV